ncbi:MAG: hypothetical protein ACD_15C00194G0001 [uncultured bacterium]|nr:MAG: hypothetical protein ACD_15C00194G0001 [uncultured bacterium]
MNSRTKIVCTIGPSSASVKTLSLMMRSGMDAARLNFSHGTHNEHAKLLRAIREAEKKTKSTITILQDLQGPKIRVGELKESVRFVRGKTAEIPVTHKNLYKNLKRGDRILIEDGLIEGVFVKGRSGFVTIQCRVGGTILSHKGINLPDSKVRIPVLTAKDKKDIAFGLKNKVDWIALSFVSKASDVKEIKKIVKSRAKICVKIEKAEALKNIKAIIKEADAIMVARGDLGIEIPAENVPIAQKEIINLCRKACKPVIVATQMLDSMIRNPRPTRAEISDVANAVIDHADAVMLSGETANGAYPVDAVKYMDRAVLSAEASRFDDISLHCSGNNLPAVINKIYAHGRADAIVTSAEFERSAMQVNQDRPEIPILLLCKNDSEARAWNLRSGIVPVVAGKTNKSDFAKFSKNIIIRKKLVLRGTTIAIVFEKNKKSIIEYIKI